jgi:predicted porin
MSRFATVFAVLLLAPLVAHAEVTLSGFVQQNTAINTVTENPDGRHYKWLEERAQLRLDATGGAWRLLAKGDFAWDHLGRQDQSELREAYVDYTAGNWDLRIGRQVLTWGLGDLVFVNDVFPKDHEALFAGRPLEYLKRGVDAVKLGAYPEFANFELVLAPNFRESRIPDARRFHLYDPMPAVTARESIKPGQGEAGLRVYRDLAGWDTALYLYRGFQRTPSMRPDNMTAPTRISYFYPQLSVYGTSVSGRVGDGVLSLEAAYYDSRQDRSGNDSAVPNSQTRWLAGYQIQPVEDLSLSLQYYAERMHDYDAYRAALPVSFPVDKRWSHTLTARLTQFYLHQTLRLSVYAAYNASNGDHFVNPELRYSFTDRIWGALGANLFGGKPWGQFGQLARDDNLYLQMRYEF